MRTGIVVQCKIPVYAQPQGTIGLCIESRPEGDVFLLQSLEVIRLDRNQQGTVFNVVGFAGQFAGYKFLSLDQLNRDAHDDTFDSLFKDRKFINTDGKDPLALLADRPDWKVRVKVQAGLVFSSQVSFTVEEALLKDRLESSLQESAKEMERTLEDLWNELYKKAYGSHG